RQRVRFGNRQAHRILPPYRHREFWIFLSFKDEAEFAIVVTQGACNMSSTIEQSHGNSRNGMPWAGTIQHLANYACVLRIGIFTYFHVDVDGTYPIKQLPAGNSRGSSPGRQRLRRAVKQQLAGIAIFLGVFLYSK